MDKNTELNPSNTIAFAREFTLKAMENGFIPKSTSPSATAKNVVSFYKTVLNSINSDD